MRRYLLFFACIITIGELYAQQITVSEEDLPITIRQVKYRFNRWCFVIYSLNNATIEFSGKMILPFLGAIHWNRKESSTPISGAIQRQDISTLNISEADCGYIIEQNGELLFMDKSIIPNLL